MREEEFTRAGGTLLGDVVAIGALRPAAGDLVALRTRVDAAVEFDLRLTAGAAASGIDDEVETALDHIVTVLKSTPAP
ncbi:hypothetical protein UB46_38305 [Burkholderiaceae bacterium 16]|nr:hypothetical protein UB46_38305 [Burkholderiaceae bacterium 16]